MRIQVNEKVHRTIDIYIDDEAAAIMDAEELDDYALRAASEADLSDWWYDIHDRDVEWLDPQPEPAPEPESHESTPDTFV